MNCAHTCTGEWNDLGRVTAWHPSGDSEHPRPESPTPVYASAGSRSSQRFWNHVPVATRFPIRPAASVSAVQIEALPLSQPHLRVPVPGQHHGQESGSEASV
jgi:hypothetical protein